MSQALRNQRLGGHRTCPQSQPWLRPPLSLMDSGSLQPGISALWGSDDPMAWFGDGSAQGHASKWAGAQEGRQPLTTLGTRGSLPAWEAQHAPARGQPDPSLQRGCHHVGAGDRRAAACTQPGHTRWGRARRRHHHHEGSLVAFGVLEPQGELKGKRRGQKNNLRAEITEPS